MSLKPSRLTDRHIYRINAHCSAKSSQNRIRPLSYIAAEKCMFLNVCLLYPDRQTYGQNI